MQKLRSILSVNIILALIIILAFFIGIIEQFNIKLYYINVLTESLILFLLIDTYITCSNNKLGFHVPGFKIFLIFTFAILISMLVNSSNLYQSYLFYRFFLTPYLLMLIIVNIPLTDRKQRKIVDFIQYLYIFQLIATVVKLLIMGTPEHPVGTIIVAGGGVATYIPLIAAGFLISKYYVYEKRKIYIILLLISLLLLMLVKSEVHLFSFQLSFCFLSICWGKLISDLKHSIEKSSMFSYCLVFHY